MRDAMTRPTCGTQGDAASVALQRSVRDERTGCWLWCGATSAKGYAILYKRIEGRYRRFRVARLLLGLASGEPRMALHLCDNPRCVNPEHLRAGTNGDNMRDAVERRRHSNTRKSHCPRGHPYTPENTRVRLRDGTARRECRECNFARHRRAAHNPSTARDAGTEDDRD